VQDRDTDIINPCSDAGIMAPPFAITEDGYEEQWQVNYLAHWLFTSHVLPTMLATAKQHKNLPGTVRIVNLSSSGHYSAPKGGINFSDVRLENASGMTRYGQSKLANILHMKTLHKLCGPGSPLSVTGEEIWVSAVHPGLVKSELGNRAELPVLMKVLLAPYRWAGGAIDGDEGAWTSIFCTASPAMMREDCGKYWQRLADPHGWQSGLAKDMALAERLEIWTRDEMQKGGWVE
jgi:retinol dehydrogenase-12